MTSNKKSILVQVTSDGMSTAENELRLKLISNYFAILDQEDYLPIAIVFYGDGVKLLKENSPILDSLLKLSEKNVKILACKTCLAHYQLLDVIKVGIIATMIDIIDLQFTADKVINL